jgi:hypothetical protein
MRVFRLQVAVVALGCAVAAGGAAPARAAPSGATPVAVGGTRTVDWRGFERAARIGQGCKVPAEPHGRLVGSGGRFQAQSDGRLELRINDGDPCLGGNTGSTSARPADPVADALAAAINYLCPNLRTTQGADDCVALLKHLFNSTRCVAALTTATVDVTGTMLASILVSDQCSSVLIEGVRQLVELVKCARMYGIARCVGRQPGQITRPRAWVRM